MLARRTFVLLAVLGGAAFAACHGSELNMVDPSGGLGAGDEHGARVQSNIARGDYAGSAVCAPCHAREYAAWLNSPMRRMTRDAKRTDIKAPFTGQHFEFRGASLTMEQEAGERFMRMADEAGKSRLFRVTKVIGGRYREDFAGVEVDPQAPLASTRADEHVLPASYLVFNGEWRYKGYSVMVHERSELEPGVVWKSACIFCHNTTPTLSVLLDDVYGRGAPSYQGSASVELPDRARPRYVVRDEASLRAALDSELVHLGQPVSAASWDLKRTLRKSIESTRDHFGEQDLVEVGIGCEACHGGARDHVGDPINVHPSLSLRSPFLGVSAPSGRPPTHAEDINRTCAKCHTVLFSRYPFTREGHGRRHDPGGSSINSGEARDFLLGECTSQLSCVKCHDPHAEDQRSKLQALAEQPGDELCASCHTDLASDEARRLHTHHASDSAGRHCLNCHMPKKNMGLAYELTRYHRIGSPTERERVEGDRPLECALCHTDRSVEQLVSTMERFWSKKYDRSALHALYGQDLSINAVEATLRYGKPHEVATAVALAGRERRREWLPLVVEQLGNEYPLVRYFARHAVEQIRGAPLPVDLNASGSEVVQNAQRYLLAHPAPERKN